MKYDSCLFRFTASESPKQFSHSAIRRLKCTIYPFYLQP